MLVILSRIIMQTCFPHKASPQYIVNNVHFYARQAIDLHCHWQDKKSSRIMAYIWSSSKIYMRMHIYIFKLPKSKKV
jgi:hypothetical protein